MKTLFIDRDFNRLICVAVIVFYGTGLLWRPGYGSAAGILLLSAVVGGYYHRHCLNIPLAERCLIRLLLLCWALLSLPLLLHQAALHDYDTYSKMLLVIPIARLLCRYPLSSVNWTGAVSTGAIFAFTAALIGSRHTLRFGGAHHPIQFGDLSLLTGLFSGCMLPLWRKKTVLFALTLIGLLSGIGASLLSGSRGGWPALLPGAILLYYHCNPGKKSARKLFILSAAAGVAVFFLPEVQSRLAMIVSDITAYQHGNSNTSLGLRFDMWHAGWQLFISKPWFGWGSEALLHQIAELVASGRVSADISAFNHLHNDYLDAAARQGIVGLSGIVLLYFVPLRIFLHRWQQIPPSPARCFAAAGIVLCSSFSIFSLSQNMLAHNSGMLFYLISLVILFTAAQTDTTQN